jgi:hypothetical protein
MNFYFFINLLKFDVVVEVAFDPEIYLIIVLRPATKMGSSTCSVVVAS